MKSRGIVKDFVILPTYTFWSVEESPGKRICIFLLWHVALVSAAIFARGNEMILAKKQ